jgi:hypothetical protein
MIVERLGDFEAAAAHVADRPNRAEKAGDHAQRGEARFLRSAEDTNLKTGFGGDGGCERGSVRRAADCFGSRRIDLYHAHRVGDGAKPPHRLDRAAKPLRPDHAGLREAFAEATQRLLVEARHRRRASRDLRPIAQVGLRLGPKELQHVNGGVPKPWGSPPISLPALRSWQTLAGGSSSTVLGYRQQTLAAGRPFGLCEPEV